MRKQSNAGGMQKLSKKTRCRGGEAERNAAIIKRSVGQAPRTAHENRAKAGQKSEGQNLPTQNCGFFQKRFACFGDADAVTALAFKAYFPDADAVTALAFKVCFMDIDAAATPTFKKREVRSSILLLQEPTFGIFLLRKAEFARIFLIRRPSLAAFPLSKSEF